MGFALEVTVNDDLWQKRLLQYMAATKMRLREVLDEEWPLLIKKIIQFTPPFRTKVNTGESGIAGDSSKSSDLSVGRMAVFRDISKTMRVFDPSEIRSKSLRRIVESQDISAFNAMALRVKSGPMAGARAVPFLRTNHTDFRNNRGRVPGRGTNRVVLGSDAVLLKQYIAEVQSHVGYARAGWAPAYNLVRGPNNAPLPSYISKFGGAGGSVEDKREGSDPYIIARNQTPWAVRKDEWQRIYGDAVYSRSEAILSKIKTKLRLASKDAGFQTKIAA